jgi:hypothetical protein
MRALLRSSAAALVALFLPGVGAAQMGTALEKLPDVDIVIESLSEQAAACGVTANGLDAVVRVALDASRLGVKIEMSETTDLSTVYVNVNVMKQDAGCIADVSLQLHRMVAVLSTGKSAVGTVWSSGTILVGPAYDFGERVNAALRELANQFLAEWIKQNPKP